MLCTVQLNTIYTILVYPHGILDLIYGTSHGVNGQFAQMGSAEEVHVKLQDIGNNFALVKINTQTEQQKFRDELAHRFTNVNDFAFIDGCLVMMVLKMTFLMYGPIWHPNGIVASDTVL